MKCWVPPCDCEASVEVEIATMPPPYTRTERHIEEVCEGCKAAGPHDECEPFVIGKA